MINTVSYFRELHHQAEPLLVNNVGDVSSARLFTKKGALALGTSSAALADTLGYADGEQLPFSLLLEVVQRIKNNTNLPLSVDLERGYSSEQTGVLQNVETLCRMGISGINLEDSRDEKSGTPLRDARDMQQLIGAIRSHLSRNGLDLFLNIRTDAFLKGLPGALDETLNRIPIYEQAGADGIFVPCLHDKASLRQVVSQSKLPVNVLVCPGLPSIAELAQIGVKRISMGSAIYRIWKKSLVKIVDRIQQEHSFASLSWKGIRFCAANHSNNLGKIGVLHQVDQIANKKK
ncbi:MAG: isocitrate lyase/phosphoenolpyruvate mutase family protein [Flavisolibacter sp.]